LLLSIYSMGSSLFKLKDDKPIGFMAKKLKDDINVTNSSGSTIVEERIKSKINDVIITRKKSDNRT
jgi:hypothetical protein